MKGIEYFENPPPVHRDLTVEKAVQLGLEEFKLLEKKDFPDDKVVWGCEYKTWCVNPMVYCSFLLRRFHILGGKAMAMELRNLNEAFLVKAVPGVKLVVNCSGQGFNDPAVFPTRGKSYITNSSISSTFCLYLHKGSNNLQISRPNLPRRKPLSRHRHPPKRRRLVVVLRAPKLPRRHNHRRHQGARQLGPRAQSRDSRPPALRLRCHVSAHRRRRASAATGGHCRTETNSSWRD